MAGRADFLVELRGFEPLTSAVRDPYVLDGIAVCGTARLAAPPCSAPLCERLSPVSTRRKRFRSLLLLPGCVAVAPS
jgi:hypothetical protein